MKLWKILLLSSLFMVLNAFTLVNEEVSKTEFSHTDQVVKKQLGDLKDAYCSGVGCEDGARQCGTVSAEVGVDIRGVGNVTVSVTYVCYEADFQPAVE